MTGSCGKSGKSDGGKSVGKLFEIYKTSKYNGDKSLRSVQRSQPQVNLMNVILVSLCKLAIACSSLSF